MIDLVLAVLATALQPDARLTEARLALEAGRPEQARTMIAAAVAEGAQGDTVDRLLADLAFTTGDYSRALAGYRTLLRSAPNDARLIERAGLAALQVGNLEEAVALLDKAAQHPGAGWRAWNGRGVAADRQGDWATADRSYDRAAALSPEQPEVLNNRGWSLLLRGRWLDALEPLEIAARLAPGNPRIAANVELARSAVSADLPARKPRETGAEWAARFNDAGVAAALQGDHRRAMAAFARAIEASDRWYERAANNLAAMGGMR